MRPSFDDNEKMSTSNSLEQLWYESESCPEGTIPILRTQKSDLLRAISLEGFGMNVFNPQMEVSCYILFKFHSIHYG